MTSQVEAIGPVPTRWRRLLNFPLVRISVAILFIAIPVAAVEIPLNLFVTDKSLRGLGALLLAAVVLVAYRTYVRVMEKRPVTELSGRGAGLEWGSGFALGVLLFSVTIGVLAAFGVYRVTGNNGWQSMLSFLPVCIFAGIFEEVLIRGILFRILEQWLGSWVALAISAIIFGALHLEENGRVWQYGALISAAGLAFGILRHASGSIRTSIITHASYNSTLFFAFFLVGHKGK